MRTFDKLTALVQKLDGSVDIHALPAVFLDNEPSLDDIRQALMDGPLGTVDKDIFFPSWTKSIHVLQGGDAKHSTMTSSEIDHAKVTIESPLQLRQMLQNEEKTPGTTSIVLQQCRSKRYSRKNPEFNVSSNNKSINTNASNSHPLQTAHHHHHHHHHHQQSHHHQSNAHFPRSTNSPSHQPLINPYSKRNFPQCDPSFTLTQPQPPPPPQATVFATHPLPSAPITAQQPYDNSNDHGILFYPDPLLQYGMMPPPPHAVYPPIYAVPWNVGCINYLPAPSVPPAWFMA